MWKTEIMTVAVLLSVLIKPKTIDKELLHYNETG